MMNPQQQQYSKTFNSKSGGSGQMGSGGSGSSSKKGGQGQDDKECIIF